MTDPQLSTNSPAWLGLVQKNVETLQFGDVHITVHNGTVVQVTRTETTRIEQGRLSSPAKERRDSTMPALPQDR